MPAVLNEYDELRVQIERLRALLENIVVRGLRACGPDELTLLRSYAEHLDQTGAGHLASMLSDLQGEIERDERTSPRKLLETQTNVRLLERLLTLRVVKGHYANAIAAMEEDNSEYREEYEIDDANDNNVELQMNQETADGAD